jgi:hypothetical protein
MLKDQNKMDWSKETLKMTEQTIRPDYGSWWWRWMQGYRNCSHFYTFYWQTIHTAACSYPLKPKRSWLIRKVIMNQNSVKSNGICRTLRWGESVGTNLNCAQRHAVRMCNVLILFSRDHGLLSWTNPSPNNHFKTTVFCVSDEIFGYKHHWKHAAVYGKQHNVIYVLNICSKWEGRYTSSN